MNDRALHNARMIVQLEDALKVVRRLSRDGCRCERISTGPRGAVINIVKPRRLHIDSGTKRIVNNACSRHETRAARIDGVQVEWEEVA